MKEKLTNALGGFGVVLYYVLSIVMAVLPFVMIGAPFLLNLLFFAIVQFFPPASIIFWIWGLIRAMTGVQDAWAIAYYILFAVAFIPFFVNIIIAFFPKKR